MKKKQVQVGEEKGEEYQVRVGEEYQVEIPNLMSKSEYQREITNINEKKSLAHENSNIIQQETNIEVHEENGFKCHSLVCGSSIDTSWNGVEVVSFTLGLYMFGKDFNLLKKLIGNKTMGDLLAFYYKKFYKSDRYRRWKEWKKSPQKKCITYGERIFQGHSLEEFSSRLQLLVPEELHTKLHEEKNKWQEKKAKLEEYVFTLKNLVGMDAFVEAIGVDKENDLIGCTENSTDLIGCTENSTKSSNAVRAITKTVADKAWSNLTYEEIINFLRGGPRLSKSKSSNFFLEAIWPRLQQKNWHNEEHVATDSKLTSIFITPGIEKFSTELVKGEHYFDSICDLLQKVASHPKLIELQTDARYDSPEQENSASQQQSANLQIQKPQHPNFNAEAQNQTKDVAFVDTNFSSVISKPIRDTVGNNFVVDREKNTQSLLNAEINENLLSCETPPKEKALSNVLLPQVVDTTVNSIIITDSVIDKEVVPATFSEDQHEEPQNMSAVLLESESGEPISTEVAGEQQNNIVQESNDVVVEQRAEVAYAPPIIQKFETMDIIRYRRINHKRTLEYLCNKVNSQRTRPRLTSETSNPVGGENLQNGERAQEEDDA